MRNGSSPSKHLSCVIVRKCVYTVIFSSLQIRHLLRNKNGRRYLTTLVTHPRIITHDSPASLGAGHVPRGTGTIQDQCQTKTFERKQDHPRRPPWNWMRIAKPMNEFGSRSVPKPLMHGRSQTTDFVGPRKPDCESPQSSVFGGCQKVN